MERMHAGRTLSIAGRSIRLELKRAYGSPEAAEAAIREAAEDTQALEQWASIVTAREHRLEGGLAAGEMARPFSFEEIPAYMRGAAVISLAAAMLAWTSEQERMAS